MELTEIISNIPIWFVVLTGILTTLYTYLTWNFNYWKKQGVKGDKPHLFVGTLSNVYVTPMDVQDMRMYKKYGRVYGLFEGRQPVLHVADPELLKIILVKDFNHFRNRRNFPVHELNKVFTRFIFMMEDDEWKELRSILTPTFTTGKIKQMISLIEACGDDMIKQLTQYAEKNEPFEAKDIMASFTIDVIATCAFGTKLESLNDPNNEFYRQARRIFSDTPKLAFLSMLFPMFKDYFPPFVPVDSLRYFERLLNNVISRRKEETSHRRDFLQLLLEAKKESEIRTQNHKTTHDTKESSKFVMTHDHLIAQAMGFIFAGFESPSTTLTFILYNFVQYDAIQDKVINEIDEVLKKHNGIISYENLSEIQYLDMVISETLRMYSPGVRLERTCVTDNYNLNGIILKKGMIIGIPNYSMHYDEEFFPNPTVFDPERFSPENRSQINPYTYLPFGSGLRNCIGMRFALMELKIAVISILRNFRVTKCAETQIPFKRKPNSLVFQPESLMIKVEPRGRRNKI